MGKEMMMSAIVSVVCFVILFVAVHVMDKRKKRKQEEERKQREAEQEKEEKKRYDAQDITPLIFTGEDVGPKEAHYFVWMVLEPEERDRANEWFDLHREILGEIDCEKLIMKKTRPILSFEEFESWFIMTFNRRYFDSKDLPHGDRTKMFQKFSWAEPRAKPVAAKKADDEVLNNLIKQSKFALDEIRQFRKSYATELKDLKVKATEVDEILKRAKAAEEERWNRFADVHKLHEELPKIIKAYEDAKKNLGKIQELGEVKSFLPNVEKLKRDIDDLVDKGFARNMTKIKEGEEARFEKVLEPIRKQINEILGKANDTNNSDGWWKEKLTALEEEFKQLQEKVPTVISVSGPHICNCAKKHSEKKNVGNFFLRPVPLWGYYTVLVLFVLGSCAIYFWSTLDLKNWYKDMLNEQRSEVDSIIEEGNDLLSDSDWPQSIPEEVLPLTEKPEEEIIPEPALVPILCDKECCLKKFGGDTKTWSQAVMCMREAQARQKK